MVTLIKFTFALSIPSSGERKFYLERENIKIIIIESSFKCVVLGHDLHNPIVREDSINVKTTLLTLFLIIKKN